MERVCSQQGHPIPRGGGFEICGGLYGPFDFIILTSGGQLFQKMKINNFGGWEVSLMIIIARSVEHKGW